MVFAILGYDNWYLAMFIALIPDDVNEPTCTYCRSAVDESRIGSAGNLKKSGLAVDGRAAFGVGAGHRVDVGRRGGDGKDHHRYNNPVRNGQVCRRRHRDCDVWNNE